MENLEDYQYGHVPTAYLLTATNRNGLLYYEEKMITSPGIITRANAELCNTLGISYLGFKALQPDW